MKHCINCGVEIAEQADVCTECGVDQSTELDGSYGDREPDERYCLACGELIYKQAAICPACGVDQPSTGSGDTDQVAAGILAILLGGLGVHKFYQGNTRNGVLYLCFFWTAIPSLLGLIEGILMLVADEAEYDEQFSDGSILGK
ncbi:NINE protein [Halorhabdus sp. CBA1104]|uniref:TM2 domain-containing protein n=1 Tax=unclassified Halorhabdus TaxID=2621901 RepID=UPI0012B21DAE|nr:MULTISPECIES: TM2 domain-containing protein [unclassified Halorhabdus]QGN07671.1 NINE protein [Halorhabdus sp. CBA1104]